jgi:hypothetical protein
MELLTTKDKVKGLLEASANCRDDDNVLIATMWYEENLAESLSAFLNDLANGKLTSPESIRRCRQKLQEENPSLRGDNYKQRHKETTKVKKELKSSQWGQEIDNNIDAIVGQTKMF